MPGILLLHLHVEELRLMGYLVYRTGTPDSGDTPSLELILAASTYRYTRVPLILVKYMSLLSTVRMVSYICARVHVAYERSYRKQQTEHGTERPQFDWPVRLNRLAFALTLFVASCCTLIVV